MGKKKKIESKSPEQVEQERLENQLKDIKEDYYYIPEPTILFNVGEKVKIDNLKDCIIDKVLENGKVYKIDYTDVNNNYGNPIIKEHQKQYFIWMEIAKECNNKNSFIENNDLKLNYSQRYLSGLLTKVYHFGVDFEPDYQRDFVWELEDKVSLINSIFNNIDIGKFVFINKGVMNPSEILDGKQRLKTICDFYEGKFQYKGYYFRELSYKDQRFFEDYNVNVGEVEDISREQILRYFIMLNTGGKLMAKEQLDKVKKMLVKEEISNERL